jgi:hypothetical protein
VSLPGTGLSHYLKTYLSEPNVDSSYIIDISNPPPLKKQNIIDVSFATSPDVYDKIDKLILGANVDQKFVVIVDDPSWLRSITATTSQFLPRMYKTIFFPIHSEFDIRTMALEINPDLTSTQQEFIKKQSGGFAKLIKYLAINPDSDTTLDPHLQNIFLPTLQLINKCTDEDLTKLGLKQDNKWISPLISSWLSAISSTQGFDITISNNLFLIEDGQDFHQLVSLPEKEIIISALTNDGKITKEKIAEIKWGEASYDSYSDQAIRKTIIRLSAKLKKYRFRPRSKIEYFLERR